jgi:hypothetical protein
MATISPSAAVGAIYQSNVYGVLDESLRDGTARTRNMLLDASIAKSDVVQIGSELLFTKVPDNRMGLRLTRLDMHSLTFTGEHELAANDTYIHTVSLHASPAVEQTDGNFSSNYVHAIIGVGLNVYGNSQGRFLQRIKISPDSIVLEKLTQLHIPTFFVQIWNSPVFSPVMQLNLLKTIPKNMEGLNVGCDETTHQCYGHLIAFFSDESFHSDHRTKITVFNLGTHEFVFHNNTFDHLTSFDQLWGYAVFDPNTGSMFAPARLESETALYANGLGRLRFDPTDPTVIQQPWDFILFDYNYVDLFSQLTTLVLDDTTNLMYVHVDNDDFIYVVYMPSFELYKSIDVSQLPSSGASNPQRFYSTLILKELWPYAVKPDHLVTAIDVYTVDKLAGSDGDAHKDLLLVPWQMDGCPIGSGLDTDLGKCVMIEGGRFYSGSSTGRCPPGRFSHPGAHSIAQCLPCPPGSYTQGNDDHCITCADGFWCPLGTVIPFRNHLSPAGDPTIVVKFESYEQGRISTHSLSAVNALHTSTIVVVVTLFVLYGCCAGLCSKTHLWRSATYAMLHIDFLSRQHFVRNHSPMVRRKTALGGIITIAVAVASVLIVASLVVEYHSDNAIVSRSTDALFQSSSGDLIISNPPITLSGSLLVTGSNVDGQASTFGVFFPLPPDGVLDQGHWLNGDDASTAEQRAAKTRSRRQQRMQHKRQRTFKQASAFSAHSTSNLTYCNGVENSNGQYPFCYSIGPNCVDVLDQNVFSRLVTGIVAGRMYIDCPILNGDQVGFKFNCTACKISVSASIALPFSAVSVFANMIEYTIKGHGPVASSPANERWSVYHRIVPGSGNIPADTAMRGIITTQHTLAPTRFRDYRESTDWQYSFTPTADIRVDVSDIASASTMYDAEFRQQSTENWRNVFELKEPKRPLRDSPYFGIAIVLNQQSSVLSVEVQAKQTLTELYSSILGVVAGAASIAALLLRVVEMYLPKSAASTNQHDATYGSVHGIDESDRSKWLLMEEDNAYAPDESGTNQ